MSVTRARERMVVLRGGALGDFILTLPVLQALRGHFPQSRLEVVGSPRFADLAVASGWADAARAIESPTLAGFFITPTELDPHWCEYFGNSSLVISYLYDPRNVFIDNVRRVTQARILLGRHRPDEGASRHAVDVGLAPLAEIGIQGAYRQPCLDIGPANTEGAAASTGDLAPGRWLAMHPGSGSERKNWPEASWRQLLGRLGAETDWHFLLVGGEAEGDRCFRLAREAPRGRCMVVWNRPLTELAVKLRQCAVYVGHDSGITHLAAALGLRGLALWGPSNLDIWRPVSPRMTVMSAGLNWSGLAVGDVMSGIIRLMREGGREGRLAGGGEVDFVMDKRSGSGKMRET